MRTLARLALKAMVFTLAPVLAAISSIVALPILTERFGAAAWAAIAIGLSTGMAASVLVELGWGLDGPPRVARARASSRAITYAFAAVSKSLMYVPAAAVAAAVAGQVSTEFRAEAAVAALAGTAFGLNANWYFIGTGSPLRSVVTDAVPRLVAALVSVWLLTVGGPALVFPLTQLAGALISPIFASTLILHRRWRVLRLVSTRRLLLTLRGQLTALRGRAASAVYLALPTTILGVVAPSGVAAFAAADRLQRMALTFLQVAPSAVLAWAAEPRGLDARWSRVRKAILANWVLGIAAGAIWAWLLEPVSHVVFSGTIAIDDRIRWLSAYVVFVTVASRAVGGIGLVSFGSIATISNSATVGAVVGAALLFSLGLAWGAIGAFAALAITETVVLAWQLIGLRRVLAKKNR